MSKQQDTENLNAAACAQPDMHPIWFDDPYFQDRALRICDTCTVRAWCLQRVDPANSWFEGVAGGHAWSKGRPVWIEERNHDPILNNYILNSGGNVQHITIMRHHKEPDELAIEGFLAGHITYNKLSHTERKMAAARMWQNGATKEEILQATRLRWTTIQQITKETPNPKGPRL